MALRDEYTFRIADVTVCLQTDQVLAEEDIFRPFVTQSEDVDFRAVFRQVDQLPTIPEKILYEDLCYRVHPDGKGGFLRSFFDAPSDMTPYAVAAYDHPGGSIRVEYLPKGAHCVSEIRNSFFHLGLEALLMERNRLCLHAACVDTAMGGILLSGPSGIGKSTQADLWCRHRGARQINGDLPILQKTKTGWQAWGSPYAGSSRCYLNECCSIRTIVILRQAPENRLRRLSPSEAFRAVWSGVTVNSWDPRFTERACDLALELISQIPVYELACTPDIRAVELLEQGI